MAVEMLIKASEKEIAGLILEFQGQPENPSQLYRQVSKMLDAFLVIFEKCCGTLQNAVRPEGRG